MGLVALFASGGLLSVSAQSQSSDATLSGLTLSNVDFGTFASGTTEYTASVANRVTETTVTPTVNHSEAGYVIKLGGVEDSDGTVSLSVGSNVITVEVTAEDNNTTQTYTVTVTRAPNTPATGAPNIGPTSTAAEPRVTRRLRAYTRNIEDEEGMENAAFSYQWISNDGSMDMDILDATGQEYTLQASDEGKTIKVRVSFTDDVGNPESLTSQATVQVVAEDAGICSRTPVIRDKLLRRVSGVRDCGFVTDAHLAGITSWLLWDGDQEGTVPRPPRIDSLKAGDFAGLSNVPTLEIRKADFTELPDGVFDGLTRLTELNLDRNKSLATVHSGAFEDLRLLTDLTLYGSAVTSLPADVFDNLLVLEELELTENELITLPPGLLNNQGELESLYIRLNKLSSLPTGIFDELEDLESLDLGSNELDSLSVDLFSELESLEYLGLRKNGISELPDGIFNGLSSLERLSLNENDLDDLPSGVFDDLSGLQYLYLEDNDLDELPDGIFDGWTSLVALDLAGNPGAPFIFGLSLSEDSNGDVVVNVSNETPHDISVTLEAYGGSLASTEVTLLAGGNSTDGTTVTRDGNGAASVRVVSVEFDNTRSTGIAVSRGAPLTLPNADGDNNLATGQPAISGTATVGQTLSVSTSGITDSDGLANATFEYQWITSDGTTDQDIDGATSSTYEIDASDVDQKLKVLVKFEDDEGNHEIVTSEATAAVAEVTNVAATGQPVIVGELLIEPGNTLTVDMSGVSDENGMPDSGFSYSWICNYNGNESNCSSEESVTLSRRFRWKTVKVSVSFTDNGGNSETVVSETVGPILLPNSPAKGVPLLSGIPKVGVRLSAVTNSVHGYSDGNGTTRNYSSSKTIQWLADGTEVQSGTSNYYTVQSTDVGKRIKFVLNFKDDDGYDEQLESAPTSLVVAADSANSPAAGAPRIHERAFDGSNLNAYWSIEVGDKLLASTTSNTRYSSNRITDENGLTNATFAFQWMRGDGTTFTDIPDAIGEIYFLMEADAGERLKVKVTFTDDAGNEETMFSAPSLVVDPAQVTVENNPAQGTATLTGTAQVGQTLTIDVSGISDADGMDDAYWNFHWFTDYDAASSSGLWHGTSFLYTWEPGSVSKWDVVASYLGKELTVMWQFKDDLDSYERGTLMTDTVVAAVPGAPRAVRLEPGTTGELDVAWVQPESDGGADITGYTVQWKEALDSWDTEAVVSEATITETTTEVSYTITGLTDGTEYTVRIIATNSVGDGSASDDESATPNASATGAPTISGTVQVGQTLTAGTSDIADTNGLTGVSYSYQWLADDMEISGATSSTYTLQSSDNGKVIKVQVTFTDDVGNDESLTSAGTSAVVSLTISGIITINYSENGTAAVATYAVTGAAQGATITWSLTGTDQDDFSISNSGVLTFSSSPDYENPTDSNTDNVYQVTVNASDSTVTVPLDVTVTVTDVDEGPNLNNN